MFSALADLELLRRIGIETDPVKLDALMAEIDVREEQRVKKHVQDLFDALPDHLRTLELREFCEAIVRKIEELS